MAALVVAIIVAVLAAAAKVTPWRSRKLTGTLTVGRVANVALTLAVVGVIWWLLGYFGAPGTRWPHVTYDDLGKLGPIAVAAAALLALIGVGATVWQKNAADARDAWWKRTEWALGWAYGEDSKDPARKTVGLAALKYQQHSRLARPEEAGFLLACVVSTIDKVQHAVTVSRTEQRPDVRLELRPETPTNAEGLDGEAGEVRD